MFYYLLQVHNQQLIASMQMKNLMRDILDAYSAWAKEERGLMGFNMAALGVMSRELREGAAKDLEDEEAVGERIERGRKKRAFASMA